ncbi:MAG TPA: DUF4919 domain-containing protein [Bacteroidales bacterium]|nr:DUF4919 domain-containing protein [Bacteroidales bacterium]
MTKTTQTIGLIVLLITRQIVYGQTIFNYKDDFKNILAKTKDQNENLSYDKLLKRFSVNDTTMTDFEVLALLIGFTDKQEFEPYKDLGMESKIYDMNGDGKFQEALDSANIFLKSHPLSVKVLFEKGYSFYKLGQKDSAAYYSYKGHRIFKAMNFSGDGKTPETPAFALGPADGQDYIYKFIGPQIGGARIGMMGSGEDKDGNFLDILEVVPKDGSPAYNLYFIIQHATDKMFSSEDMKNMEDVFKELENSDKKDNKKR